VCRDVKLVSLRYSTKILNILPIFVDFLHTLLEMADIVQQRLEDKIPALEQLERVGLFTNKEVK